MHAQFEMTDTYGGESNYSWVKRATLDIKEKTSNLALVRRAKQWSGLTGLRFRVENYGDMIAIRPVRQCVVLFITFPEVQS